MNRKMIARELVKIAKSLTASQQDTEEIEGIAYSESQGRTINCTAEFEVTYDEDGCIEEVGDLVYAYDGNGNDVTDDIDSESIYELADKLKRLSNAI